ncbi:hypothetical protein J6590_075067 [Homalodisca vitripennis]|nr:hypothetical protein J6590_075067 [Homalodisca vitripennis]
MEKAPSVYLERTYLFLPTDFQVITWNNVYPVQAEKTTPMGCIASTNPLLSSFFGQDIIWSRKNLKFTWWSPINQSLTPDSTGYQPRLINLTYDQSCQLLRAVTRFEAAAIVQTRNPLRKSADPWTAPTVILPTQRSSSHQVRVGHISLPTIAVTVPAPVSLG